MEPDTALVTGLGLAALSIPAVVSAFADSRPPRVAALVLVIAGGLMVYALSTKAGGYAFSDLPDVFYGFVGERL